MRVFISWSGERSKAVAATLREYLPRIIQALKPWMSEEDLAAGQRWEREIGDNLRECDVGICVVTSDNVTQPWLNFEAGAISKSTKARLIPFLFDMRPSDLAGPLTQFQAKDATQASCLGLLQDLNAIPTTKLLEDNVLKDTFELHWTKLEAEFQKIRDNPKLRPEQPKSPRSEREVLDEILALVRALQPRSGSFTSGLISHAGIVAELPGAVEPDFILGSRPVVPAGGVLCDAGAALTEQDKPPTIEPPATSSGQTDTKKPR